MGNIVEPVLASISQAIEDILLTMHNEDFSQYVNFFNHVEDDSISNYDYDVC